MDEDENEDDQMRMGEVVEQRETTVNPSSGRGITTPPTGAGSGSGTAGVQAATRAEDARIGWQWQGGSRSVHDGTEPMSMMAAQPVPVPNPEGRESLALAATRRALRPQADGQVREH